MRRRNNNTTTTTTTTTTTNYDNLYVALYPYKRAQGVVPYQHHRDSTEKRCFFDQYDGQIHRISSTSSSLSC